MKFASGIRQIFRDFGTLAAAIACLLKEMQKMNATMAEIKQDLDDDRSDLKTLKTTVDAQSALLNQIKAQLDTLIIAGQPSVADLNALRDGLLDAKAQIEAENTAVQANLNANTTGATNSTDPTPPEQAPVVTDPISETGPLADGSGLNNAKPTQPDAPVAPGGPSSTEEVVGKPGALPGTSDLPHA